MTLPAGTAAPRCWALDEQPLHIRDRYRRLALVSHPRHLAGLDPADEETLIVSCNWLVWQEALAAGRHCIHIESWWTDRQRLPFPRDLFVRANDWMYIDGKDVTMFRGVSLGRKFLHDVFLLILERDRLIAYLTDLVGRYRPDEIVYFDCRTDLTVLTGEDRYRLMVGIARDHDIGVVDRTDPIAENDSYLPQTRVELRHRALGRSWRDGLRSLLRRVFETGVDAMARLRRIGARPRPSVLMPVSHLTGLPLMGAIPAGDMFAMPLAAWLPYKRNLLAVLRYLARGVLPVSGPRPGLSADDRAALDRMERALETAWRSGAAEANDIVRHFVRTCILAPKLLWRMAEQVKWAECVLARHRPDVVLTDGFQNPVTNIFLELAKQRGLATAVTWHSHYLYDIKQPILGGDDRAPSVVDVCFTWGTINELWLDAMGARCRRVRTGSVKAAMNGSRAAAGHGRGHVLLLQYAVSAYDLAWPQAGQYQFFVEAVRMLRDLGYRDLRVKLHPGMLSFAYYTRISRLFALPCEVCVDGAFADHLAWADVVIGPVHSGAMVETLASGKPYYPVALRPNSLNEAWLRNTPVFSDVASLHAALESGRPLDQRTLMNDLTSLGEIGEPARRIWNALEDMARCR